MVKKIKKTRFTSAIIHGDVLEANSKTSVGEGVYEQTLTPDEQLEEIYKILKPIRGKILGISRGNHEVRASKNEGIDLINVLCRQLDVPRLLSHSLHTFHFDDVEKDYTLCVWHGRTGATTRAGKMRVVEKVSRIYEAIVTGRSTVITAIICIWEGYKVCVRCNWRAGPDIYLHI